MSEPTQPQDHLPKALPAPTVPEPDEFFTFTADDGTEYKMTKATLDVVTPGFIRRHRKDETDLVFSALEELGSQEFLDLMDSMTGRRGAQEWKRFEQEFSKHLGASLGE